MNIDIIAIQAFVQVVETGSFTKAAKRIGRTQSAVSQQILKLEDQLGQELFSRDKTLTLTHHGELFLSYARRIIALQQEAIDCFKEPDLKGEVRFGIPEDFATMLLSNVLTDFSRSHPRIMLNVECDLTLNLFNRFILKEFDLVLVKMNQPEGFPNGVKVWTEPLEWVGDIDLIQPDKPLPLVLAPQPCVYRKCALSSLDAFERKWRLVFLSPSYAGVTAAVKAGLGLTVLPRTMIPSFLKPIANGLLPPLEDIHVSLLKHREDSAAINSFEKFVIRQLKK
jgi:DNA-binding transcriptional LysR family regulator